MKRAGGYTIIEVLIVLAVTGALLVSASVLLREQSGETVFQQSMRDLDSKIQNIAKDVSSNLFPNADKYTCSTASGKPVLKEETSGGLGNNQDCLFLGKAIQVTLGQGAINIYTVLGGRAFVSGGQTTVATTFAQTNPEPAIASDADLSETFTPIANGMSLLNAKYIDKDGNAPSTEADMAGFYNDLEGSTAAGQQLLAKAYAYTTNAGNQRAGVATCIEGTGCSSVVMTHWLLCYKNGAGNKTALLDIVASSSGISTQLKFVACS